MGFMGVQQPYTKDPKRHPYRWWLGFNLPRASTVFDTARIPMRLTGRVLGFGGVGLLWASALRV